MIGSSAGRPEGIGWLSSTGSRLRSIRPAERCSALRLVLREGVVVALDSGRTCDISVHPQGRLMPLTVLPCPTPRCAVRSCHARGGRSMRIVLPLVALHCLAFAP